MRGGTSIPANSDLNNYTTPGNYYCSSSDTTPTLINAPFKNSAFVLKVLMGNGTNYPTQVYEELITGKKAYRCYASEQGGWKDYVYFSDDATVILAAQNTTPPYKIFSSSSNDQEVDEYLEDYSQPYASHTHYYIAMNLAFVHSTLGGGDMLIEGYKANENYEWQKATKYDSSGIVSFARSKMNQIWTDWNSKNIS